MSTLSVFSISNNPLTDVCIVAGKFRGIDHRPTVDTFAGLDAAVVGRHNSGAYLLAADLQDFNRDRQLLADSRCARSNPERSVIHIGCRFLSISSVGLNCISES